MIGDSGAGFVRCADGHLHWGRFGAAGLLAFVADADPLVLLQRRSRMVQHAGSWGLPGGGLHRGEAATAGALRETAEECDLDTDQLAPGLAGTGELLVDAHGGWSYTTVVARLPAAMEVRGRGREVTAMRWFRRSAVGPLRLHPGLAASWPRLAPMLDRQ